ncbi:MAG: hypothetical protein IPL04_06855 [Chitinophagaceae bacterium]|nr:hypothetical protein [Chitinophagaceae bacterium]
MYVSFDKGNSFMLWNTGTPKSMPVHDIAIQEREMKLYLAHMVAVSISLN